MNNLYDVLIIGGGPAGLTAAVYATRGNLKTAFIEKAVPGGKLSSQSKIENWPGDAIIKGADLALRMFNHARNFGAQYLYGDVIKINNISEFEKEVVLADGQKLYSKSVIIASGMINRVPKEIKNLEKFESRGLSYCAICDGPIYKGNNMAIIGGGNSAIEEAAYVANIANKVYVFVKDEMIADKALIDELRSKENVEIFENSSVLELNGTDNLEKITVSINNEIKELEVKAIFPYIGFLPNTDFVKDLNVLDEKGFILTDENMETSVANIFAIGDVRQKTIRQITTAANDGTIAAKVLTNRI